MHRNEHRLISSTADAHFGARLGTFFIAPDFLKTMYRSTIQLQFSLLWKLQLGLGLDSELHYFSIFLGELRITKKTKRTPYFPRISRTVTSL